MKTHRWYPWLFGTAIVVLIALLPLFMAQPQGSGFNAFRQYISSAVAPDVGLQQNSLIKYHQLLWTVTGAPAACTVALDSSVDGVSWTAGGAIAGQTCTSNGQSAITGIVQVNYVRINLTAFSGGSSPTITVNYEGWAYNPVGSSGTITANSGTAGSVATYAAAGGSTTVGPDPCMISNGTGTLTMGGPAPCGTVGIYTLQGSTSGSGSWNCIPTTTCGGLSTAKLVGFTVQCKITAAVTLSTAATNICTWTLPGAPTTWAWQCSGTFNVTAGTSPTFSLGMSAAALTSETGNASIGSVTGGTGITQVYSTNSATSASTGNQNIATGATLTTVTNAPWTSSGTIQATAAGGAFSITGTLGGTTPAGTVSVGSTCWLY